MAHCFGQAMGKSLPALCWFTWLASSNQTLQQLALIQHITQAIPFRLVRQPQQQPMQFHSPDTGKMGQ